MGIFMHEGIIKERAGVGILYAGGNSSDKFRIEAT